jgi:hypothetical protein
MSRVEGAECEDYDECEVGVGRASGFPPPRCLTLGGVSVK